MIEEKQKESLRKTDKEPALSKKEVDTLLSSLSPSTLEDLELLDNDFTYEQKKEMQKRYPNIYMRFENRSSVY